MGGPNLFQRFVELDTLLFMASRETTRNPEVLERKLLLAFVTVATVCVLWHLGGSLDWLWRNCAPQLHAVLTGLK
jgi:Flp pilus assembly pilin Flp